MNKPRIVKDYDKLGLEVKEQIKLAYPFGFEGELVSFKNAEGKNVSALPFETEDKYYLVRMTISEAQAIIEDDDDYDDDGNLKEEIKEEYEEKYDLDNLDEDMEVEEEDDNNYSDKKEDDDEDDEEEEDL